MLPSNVILLYGEGSKGWGGLGHTLTDTPLPLPPGTCFNFHSGRGGGGAPPSAQVHLKIWVLGPFFSRGKNFSVPLAHAIYCVRVAPGVLHMPCAPCAPWAEYDLCAMAAEFRKTRRVRNLRGKRKDKGTTRRKTDVSDAEVPSDPESLEVPSDPESLDDEALSDNFSYVSHSGSDKGLSSSSDSSSSSTTNGGSSSGESNSD